MATIDEFKRVGTYKFNTKSVLLKTFILWEIKGWLALEDILRFEIHWFVGNMEDRDFKRSKDKKETTHRSLIYDARHLTNGGKTAIIKLDNKEYTLRITKNGKLILSKWAF